MAFADTVILIKADPGTDEIVLVRAGEEVDGAIDASHVPEWQNAIGRQIFWAWELINHRGYHDALQLQFENDVDDEPHIVQLVAMASSLRIILVRPH